MMSEAEQIELVFGMKANLSLPQTMVQVPLLPKNNGTPVTQNPDLTLFLVFDVTSHADFINLVRPLQVLDDTSAPDFT